MRKSVPEYTGYYECDEYGNFYSLRTGKKLAKVVNSYGYQQVTLSREGTAKTYRAHKLIARAFLGEPVLHEEVNHKDGNKQNNNVSNLEWCSRKQNAKHAVANGLYPVAEDMPHHKLTDADVEEAWLLVKQGAGMLEMAERFDCAYRTLYRRFKKKYGALPLTSVEARRRGGLASVKRRTSNKEVTWQQPRRLPRR